MNHKAIIEACAVLKLSVQRVPATGRHSYEAVCSERLPRVYWSTSDLGGMLGLPRVITVDGRDTHARTIAEIKYLVAESGVQS